MATKINLLPVELGAGRSILQVARTLNKVSIIAGVVFLVVGVSGIVYLFLLQRQVTDQVNKNNQLQTSIKNLQATEQKLVLIKDRIGKIKTILSQKTAYDNSGNIQNILLGLPSDVVLGEAEISPAQIRFSVTSKTSLGMVSFLTNLTSQSKYKQMVLKNFNFRPSSGYSITVEAN